MRALLVAYATPVAAAADATAGTEPAEAAARAERVAATCAKVTELVDLWSQEGPFARVVPALRVGGIASVVKHTLARFMNPLMSRVHLRIIKKADGMGEHYYVVDNRSTNGSFLNGKKLLPDEVQNATVIAAGIVSRCRLVDEAQAFVKFLGSAEAAPRLRSVA